jgi:WD40 repeat protein
MSTFQSSEGAGITEISWSPDARYMYLIPRQSTNIEIWDIRSTGKVVGILTGRQAITNQRIWTDLSADGQWMISGGTEGIVKGWKLSDLEDTTQPSVEFAAHNGALRYWC